MPRRRKVEKGYIDPQSIAPREDPPNLAALAMAVPMVVTLLDTSFVKAKQEKPDWSLYKLELRDGNPFVVREMCDRCGKVWIPPRWRKIRAVNVPELGTVYVETGICKTCINASVYVDQYLDGDPLTEVEAKKLFYRYAEEYERAWRMVIAAAPVKLLTEAEWQKACKFFNGCAFCGGHIEIRAKYFPTMLNGKHTPWNVIPMCDACYKAHNAGRQDASKTVKRYKVFSSSSQFNKQKTTRMYLLQQMRNHGIYMDPLLPYMKRFKEEKVLKGSE